MFFILEKIKDCFKKVCTKIDEDIISIDQEWQNILNDESDL